MCKTWSERLGITACTCSTQKAQKAEKAQKAQRQNGSSGSWNSGETRVHACVHDPQHRPPGCTSTDFVLLCIDGTHRVTVLPPANPAISEQTRLLAQPDASPQRHRWRRLPLLVVASPPLAEQLRRECLRQAGGSRLGQLRERWVRHRALPCPVCLHLPRRLHGALEVRRASGATAGEETREVVESQGRRQGLLELWQEQQRWLEQSYHRKWRRSWVLSCREHLPFSY
mmetsp:Transcript_52664/g.114317  ORF Transcript_52664/g.114317 Transcript_52664/m.114317 type:complete len:228 (-) Transcript_52664:418-1101(-)